MSKLRSRARWLLTAGLLLANAACVGAAATPDGADAALEAGLAAYDEGDTAKALRLLTPLALGGRTEAQLVLGYLHFEGDGVKEDYVEAYAWFSLAARQGDEEAADMVEEMEDELPQGQLQRARERAAALAQQVRSAPPAATAPASQPAETNRGVAAPPAANAPRGPFDTLVAQDGDVLRVLLGRRRGGSARALLTAAAGEAAGWFDGPPRVTSAYVDRTDGQGLASFEARVQGTAVKGVVVAGHREGQGAVALLHDRPERLPQTLPQMMQLAQPKLQALLPAPAGRARGPLDTSGWQTVDAGSLRLRMPAGWRVTSANAEGMVTVGGPSGEQMALGFYAPIHVPFYNPLLTYPFVAPFSEDPREALANVLPQLARYYAATGEPIAELTGVGDMMALPIPNQAGGLVEFDINYGRPGAMRPHHALGLISSAPTSNETWNFYWSTATAPVEVFAQSLPIMLEIWGSWRIDDEVFQRRFREAAASLKRCGEIIGEVNANQQKTFDKTNAAWDRYIRGGGVTATNPHTGETKPLDPGQHPDEQLPPWEDWKDWVDKEDWNPVGGW